MFRRRINDLARTIFLSDTSAFSILHVLVRLTSMSFSYINPLKSTLKWEGAGKTPSLCRWEVKVQVSK